MALEPVTCALKDDVMSTFSDLLDPHCTYPLCQVLQPRRQATDQPREARVERHADGATLASLECAYDLLDELEGLDERRNEAPDEVVVLVERAKERRGELTWAH